MKMEKWTAMALSALLVSCSTTPGDVSRRSPAFTGEARELTDRQLLQAASGDDLSFKSGRVIVDNDAAFQAKIDVIRSGKSGETLRLVYYIFSDDESSSYFASELLAAARRGVRVRLMLDYITNYKHLDLFEALERESGGLISIRLYGKPTANIVRDALFLTRPCPASVGVPGRTECSDFKWNSIQQELAGSKSPENYTDYFSSLFLSGLGGRSGLALRTAVLMGQQIDLKQLRQGSGSPEEQKQLREFLQLFREAKIDGDAVANLKLFLAIQLYGDDVLPLLNQIYGRIPLSQMGASSGLDWMHLTDFTHHKLVLLEDRSFVLGGRNIENSYHMKRNEFSAKYTFMDVDFAGELRGSGNGLAASYDDLWNFRPLVADLAEVQRIAPNDIVMNSKVFGGVVQGCSTLPNSDANERAKLQACLQSGFAQATTTSRQQRQNQSLNKMREKAQVYLQKYLPSRDLPSNWSENPSYAMALSERDKMNALGAYIENLPFNAKRDKQKRVFGALNGRELLPWNENELAYGKSIHYLWIRGLENACATSAKDGRPRRVILHSAYWLPSANVFKALGKMMDGTWDCARVKVDIVTNSVETTDLNVINVLAGFQMKAFFDIYRGRGSLFGGPALTRAAQFDMYEYQPPRTAQGTIDNDSKVSAHMKVNVLGDDIMVGSANGDVRSFYMDTNNGVYLRRTPDLVNQYISWIDSKLRDPRQTKRVTEDYITDTMSPARLHANTEALVNYWIDRLNLKKRMSAENIARLNRLREEVGESVLNASRMILSRDYIEVWPRPEDLSDWENEKMRRQIEIKARFNRALMLL